MSTENTQKIDITEIISRMKEALGVTSDVGLCRKLGSKSTGLVGNWRKTGVVPDGAIAKASQISERPVEWLKTGKGEPHQKIAEAAHLDADLSRLVIAEVQDQYGSHPIELTPQEITREIMIRSLPEEARQHIDYLIHATWAAEQAKRSE